MKDLINANQVAIKDIGQNLQLIAQRLDRLEDIVKQIQKELEEK